LRTQPGADEAEERDDGVASRLCALSQGLEFGVIGRQRPDGRVNGRGDLGAHLRWHQPHPCLGDDPGRLDLADRGDERVVIDGFGAAQIAGGEEEAGMGGVGHWCQSSWPGKRRKGVSSSPCNRMSKRSDPSAPRAAIRRFLSDGEREDSSGSAARASVSSGREIRGERPVSRPRARLATLMQAALPGSVGPGSTVEKLYSPSGSTAARPKPVKVKPSRRSDPVARGTVPFSSGCQISRRASGTGTPAPSYTTPCRRTARAEPAGPGALSWS